MSAKIIAEPPNPNLRSVWGLRSALGTFLNRFTHTTNSTGRTLALEERVAIGPKKSLVIVRCHTQRFLVAIAGETIGPVVEITPLRPGRRARKDCEA